MMVWKMFLLFQGARILRFHVNLRCNEFGVPSSPPNALFFGPLWGPWNLPEPMDDGIQSFGDVHTTSWWLFNMEDLYIFGYSETKSLRTSPAIIQWDPFWRDQTSSKCCYVLLRGKFQGFPRVTQQWRFGRWISFSSSAIFRFQPLDSLDFRGSTPSRLKIVIFTP